MSLDFYKEIWVTGEKTILLLGACLYSVQRLEFGLYGLAAHYSHIQKAQANRQFKDLDPEKFLRGDLSDLRATLGQVARTFGEELKIEGDFLDGFLERRNVIVHRFWRYTNDRKDDAPFADRDQYLSLIHI